MAWKISVSYLRCSSNNTMRVGVKQASERISAELSSGAREAAGEAERSAEGEAERELAGEDEARDRPDTKPPAAPAPAAAEGEAAPDILGEDGAALASNKGRRRSPVRASHRSASPLR